MALGRLLRFSEEPKALLPWWLLGTVVLAGAFAGVGAHEAGAPGAVAAVLSVLVSAGSAALARRELARRGRRGFEDWPSADWEYAGDPKVGPFTDLLNTAALFGGGAAAGALVLATGMGEDEIWIVPAWLACGVLAAWPALDEVDARHALRVRRRHQGEERRIAQAAGLDADADARAAGRRPAPTDVTEVPVKRAAAWRWSVGTVLLGVACLAVAVLAVDLGIVFRGLVLLAVPGAVIGFLHWLMYVRAPAFLRLTPDGVDVLGGGEVPWSEIAAVELTEHGGHRWLYLDLRTPVGDALWATPVTRRLSRSTKGGAVQLSMRFCAWPPEQVLATVRAYGVEDVEVFIP